MRVLPSSWVPLRRLSLHLLLSLTRALQYTQMWVLTGGRRNAVCLLDHLLQIYSKHLFRNLAETSSSDEVVCKGRSEPRVAVPGGETGSSWTDSAASVSYCDTVTLCVKGLPLTLDCWYWDHMTKSQRITEICRKLEVKKFIASHLILLLLQLLLFKTNTWTPAV